MTLEETQYYYDKYYKNGISTFELGKRFGHTHHYFLDAFKKYGFEIRNNKTNSRKYSVDADYFANIDTHEKAYWLGFLYADGYVCKTKEGSKKVGLALSVKDELHIKKFNEALHSTYPIHTYTQTHGYTNNTIYSRVIITSDKLFDDLSKLGVVERKTSVLKPPPIKEEFYPSFILGYFDGDGCIFCNQCRSPFYSINIVGTDEVLSFIHSQFVKNNITTKRLYLEKRKEKQQVSYIRYGGNRVVSKIYEYLYQNIDEQTPLQRKRELFLKCYK